VFKAAIVEAVEDGLSAQRIYQDLRAERIFQGSYQSVKRFVRRIRKTVPLPFRRMETAPGEQVQVDFGKGAPIEEPGRKRRRPHLFRIVLSFSRKAYSEVVWRQTTECFIRCLENAFWRFRGVPKTVVLDNLRAAVSKADWYDPELNPKVEEFGKHYGTVFLPTKPYTPRHKGKIERGVGYAQENALKARVFKSLAEENRFLDEWEAQIADTRIHGTIRKQVRLLFEGTERTALQPLPLERFPYFSEGERAVHMDGFISVEGAYYMAPPSCRGQRVFARWDSRLVRIFRRFDGRMELLETYVRGEPGTFSSKPHLIAKEKISGIELGAEYLLSKARVIGPHSARWSQAMIRARGITGIRVLQGFLNLAGKHPKDETERACEAALAGEAFRLKALRALLGEKVKEKRLPFMESHPIIRDLAEYGSLVPDFSRPDPFPPPQYAPAERSTP